MNHAFEALRRPSPEDVGDETFVSRWFADYVDSGRAKLAFPVRQPHRTLEMLRRLHRLPCIPVHPSDGVDGRTIWSALHRPWIVRFVLGSAISVLVLPEDPSEYLLGRPKHSLRQKVRAAEQAGLRYRTVDDPDERASLMAFADEYERTEAVASMRNTDASNTHLLPLGYWQLAEGPDGRPLLLAIAAVDGDVAVLRYYRTLVFNEHASLARYGAMPRLVEAMTAAGVRIVFEAGRPHWTDNGIRQFQRKLGFRIVRVAV